MSTTLTMDQQAPAETTPATSTAIPYPEVQMRDQPTDKAIERADQFNYMRLVKHLRYGGFENAQAFLDNNFDALYANFRGLAQSMDIIQERLNPDETQLRKRLNSADPAVVKAAKKQIDKNAAEVKKTRKDMVRLAIYAVERYQNDPALLDTRLGNKGWTTPLDEQFKMDRQSAYNQRAVANLKQSVRFGGASMHSILKAGTAIGSAGLHVFKIPVHLLSATADLAGWSKTHRNIIFAAWTGILALVPALPMPAAWLESTPASSGVLLAGGTVMASPTDGSPLRSCAVKDLFPTGLTAASFEKGFNTSDPKMLPYYQAAQRGIGMGVHPAALYAVSKFETINFSDTMANKSTADGPFQTTIEEKLHQLARYRNQTIAYRDMKARIENNTATENDRMVVSSVESTVRTYLANPGPLIARLKSRNGNYAENLAMDAARTPELAGDLMSAKIKEESPQLTIAALEGKSDAQFFAAIGRYYETHLMGVGGGNAFHQIVNYSGSTRINDPRSIRQAYLHSNPGDQSRANFFSGYYSSIRERNRAIFTGGPDMTFGQVRTSIRDAMERSAKPVLRGMERGEEKAKTEIANCLELQARGQNLDRTSIATAKTTEELGPAYRSMYSVAWERAGNAYVANTSAGFRNSVSSVATTASSTFEKATRALSSKSAPAAPRQQLQVNWQSTPN